MFATRTKKITSYGKKSQRYVAVSDSRRFMTDPVTETPQKQPDSSPPQSSKSIYSPSPEKSVLKSSKRNKKTKTTEKTNIARRPLRTLCSNHQSSPFMPPKAAASKKHYTAIGHGTPQLLGQRSPYVEMEIRVLEDSGRRVSEERRRKIVLPSFEPSAQKVAGSPAAKWLRKQPHVVYDIGSDSDSDFLPSPISLKVKKLTKMPRKQTASETLRPMATRASIVKINDGRPLSIASSSSPDIRHKSRTSRRKQIILDYESEDTSDLKTGHSEKKPERTIFTVNSRPSNPPVECSLLPASNSPTKPLVSLTSSAPEIEDPIPAAIPATLTPFPLLRLTEQRKDSSITSESRVRPLTPLRPGRLKNSPADFVELTDEESDSSLSLDMSMDAELELALKIAQVNLHDIPRSANELVTSTKAVLASKNFVGITKQSRSSGSSQLRPSLKVKSPVCLRPLLAECGQEAPFDFKEFVEVFPFDQIHASSSNLRTSLHPLPSYQKVGEASYSEVFGIGNVVLKVIPLLDDSTVWDDSEEGPSLSEAKDVLKEIIVTRTMGNSCDGFTRLLRAHVVQGKYPDTFLTLWDDYNVRKGSESIRPDSFSSSQSFAIIILPHGGQDLEAFAFDSNVGWRQASSIFWQVTKSLATAENLFRFEHRDLHWGQILISKLAREKINDSTTSDVQATIIDLGLARIDSVSEEGDTNVCWTPFADEIFEGEGDYQYDVYRMMKVHNKNGWEEFSPLTNIMWLHYLCGKLLRKKKLKIPAATFQATSTQTRSGRKGRIDAVSKKLELSACNILLSVEEALGEVISCLARNSARKTKASQGKKASKDKSTLATDHPITSAQDLLRLARLQGWTS